MKFKPQHIPALDGLRGIAILMVLWLHTFQYGAPVTNTFIAVLAKSASIGQMGVDLFFVLSGFLITRILLFNKTQSHYFLNFYFRRILRIFPLYYGFLFVYFIVFPILKGNPIDPTQLWFWAYLQNIAFTFEWPANGPNHFWSLAVEEHFYLVWPLIVFYLNPKQLLKAILILLLICLASRAVLLYFGLEVFYFSLCRIDGLVMGAFLALLEQKNKIEQYKRVYLRILLFLMATLAPLYFIFTGKAEEWIQLFKSSFVALMITCIIGFILSTSEDHWSGRILQSPFLIFTGKISYGLYVLQGVGFHLAWQLGFFQHYFIMALLGGLVINYTIAYSSFRFFETPFLKYKARFS